MNIQRTRKTTLMVSFGELVQALKLLYPGILDITGLSDTGRDVTVTVGGNNVTLTHLRTADPTSPAPPPKQIAFDVV